jgi:hypothetical protein
MQPLTINVRLNGSSDAKQRKISNGKQLTDR